MYQVSNFFKSLSLMLVIVLATSLTANVMGSPPDPAKKFEQQLNLFELKMNKVMDAFGDAASSLSTPTSSASMLSKISKLEREVNRVGGILIGLQVKGSELNSSELTMGLNAIEFNINALRCACNSAIAAAANGTLTLQQMAPMDGNITEIFRLIDDCLRREIQVIRGNS